MVLAAAPRPVPVIQVAEGVADPEVLLGLESAAENDLAARPSLHDGQDDHEHDDFETVVIAMGEISDPADLAVRIERLAQDQRILRVKGYAAVAGRPMRCLVQAVGARVRHQYDRPWRADEARQTRLAVIGEHDRVDEAAIRSVLEG